MNLTHWISLQRIDLAAYYLSIMRPYVGSNAAHNQRFMRVAAILATLVDQYYDRDEPNPQLLMLSPASLHLLSDIPDQWINRPGVNSEIKKGLSALRHDPTSVFGSCKILAHHILHGSGSAERIVRLAKKLFGIQAAISPKQTTAKNSRLANMTNTLSVLRSPFISSESRIGAIDELTPLHLARTVADHLKHILLHHTCLWPLFVFPESQTDVGISIPLMMDVSLDTSRGNEGVDLTGLNRINVDVPDEYGKTFRDYANLARTAAWTLWRSSHGNVGHNLRQKIENAHVTIDFSIAESIMDGIIENPQLGDGSASAYLSQVILGRFLGRSFAMASAITGIVGARCTQRNQGLGCDFEFDAPGHVSQKARYVFQMRRFHRLVLPDSCLTDSIVQRDLNRLYRSSEYVVPTETVYPKHLSNVADCVQLGGWRRYNYIRCREIQWALHAPGRPGLIPLNDSRVDRILRLFECSHDTVLTLDDAEPLEVASALFHIDNTLRPALGNGRRVPPGLSWTIVRMIESEEDEQFWHTLWTTIGASGEDFERLVESPTRARAATLISAALNGRPGKESPSHRAPDIVILLYDEDILSRWQQLKNPSCRPLALFPILHEIQLRNDLRLSGSRIGNEHPGMARLLGRTRIVCVPLRQMHYPDIGTPSLQVYNGGLLDKLTIFRWGFTLAMAARLIGRADFRGKQLHEAIDKFRVSGLIHEISGQFFIPHIVRQRLDSGECPEYHSAESHYAAAISIAPYLVSFDAPGLGYDMAFLPENVHEASYHLRQAYAQFNAAANKAGRNRAWIALSRLVRFVETPGWRTVFGLVRSGDGGACRDAYELAEDLIGRWERHSIPVHPVLLCQAAKALSLWSQRAQKERVIALYSQAQRNCVDYPEEQTYNELFVLNAHTAYLERYCPEESEVLLALDNRIADLHEHWDSHMGVYFERMGDRETLHDVAAIWYLRGIRIAPTWSPCWLKAVASLSLAGQSVPESVLRDLVEMTDQSAQNIINRAENHFYSQKKADLSESVHQRWLAGCKSLTDIWTDRQGCRDLLRLFGQGPRHGRDRG